MANEVIFNGAPSQIINLPALIKGGVVIAAVAAVHLCAAAYFPLQWRLVLVQSLAVLVGVGLPFWRTASTEIVIDSRRITWSQGWWRKRASYLDIARIRHVSVVDPWWQRVFGTATIMLETDDARHRVRRLPGIRGADRIGEQLMGLVSACRAADAAAALVEAA
ncbi:PH domain-containing protein [Pararobbsia silviterrae]|uniref:PH domain-containing protein n=1 Tax=Pararobbsia silviterrae TaxID=1792498 RepID=A0A494Y569_9BURK|nr:PH domain-containing protein [Pararobbsia silviterrae]RKP55711.1 PH domain-containing protein [Pararobbsia silviterrae]